MRGTAAEIVRNARALVFDFDGTLVDSNAIKRTAFDECFAGFPEKLPEIRAYCHGNNHTPRWEKFEHVVRDILGLPYTEAEGRRLAERYASLTTERVTRAPETPGADAFLRSLSPGRSAALLSSTPHEILLQILKARRWEGRFETVRGAPLDKGRWLKDFRIARGLEGAGIVFFGDTPEDARAAREGGVSFIAVANPALGPEADARITDFRELIDGDA